MTAGLRGTINYLYNSNSDDAIQNYSVQSGPSTSYTYYPDGSLDTLVWSPVAGQFTYTYTLTEQYQGLTFPTGATRNYTYDDQGRLLTLTNLLSGGGNLATYAYGYDLDYTNSLYDRKGQRTSMTATVPAQGLSAHQFKYEYDPLYQLKKVTYPNVTPFSGEVDSWTYDAIGNRLTNTVNSSTQTYTYQQIGANSLNWQRLMNDGTNAYTYDLYGNVKTRTGYTFNWDMESRMTSITGTSSYIYDYQNRRESRTVGAATNTYLYDGLNLIEEQGASTADYLFGLGIDEPLAMSRGGQAYYYIVDGLGSVAEVSNSAGTVQNSYLYDAWGQTRSQTGPLANPFSYSAREPAEASTMFYRARYYQPGVGRFLSEDPFVNALQGNALANSASSLFSYAAGDPVSSRDPLGLTPCKILPVRGCAAGCMQTYQYRLCLVREANHGSHEALLILEGLSAVSHGSGALPRAPVVVGVDVQGVINVDIVMAGLKRCLNDNCATPKCMVAPASPIPGSCPLCKRGYPFFPNPVLPSE